MVAAEEVAEESMAYFFWMVFLDFTLVCFMGVIAGVEIIFSSRRVVVGVDDSEAP